MLILAIIIGCLLGFGLAYMCIGILVAKSNNHGDSKGDFQDFSNGSWRLLQEQNNIRKP